ncbi:TfoX/Sxy family protein [Pelomonas sp. UHG3]|uniref:TfoX/Sxy family protein n=1 Tax=Roseateles hydrophilus TaxID=2975054 RepID=A0ACC6C9I5_9BURK|nr:TfoX/Sxy family protein [Pelomonas sp. UHG3]MCY4745086.1 TfoX/Sxy family protein [Pelomonas sp. UHG3]
MDALSELCAELLAPLGPVRTRPMFGGRGFYVDGLFMALIADGQFYLKADAQTRAHFVDAGCPPFRYATRDGERVMHGYYRPPEEALESAPLMLPWARLAMEAALRAANAKAAPRSAPAKKTAARKPAPGRG